MTGNNQKMIPTIKGQTENEIKKYIEIVKKRKWWVVTVFIFVYLIWLAFIITSQSKPVYTSHALLTFQDPRSMTPLSEIGRGTRNASKGSLIKTNLLLGQVVEKLQLNYSIATENINRRDLFRYTQFNRNSKPGDYKIVKKGDQYDLLYSNEDQEIKDKFLLTFRPTDTVSVDSVIFAVNHDFLSNSKLNEFEFKVRDFDATIANLRAKVSYDLDKSQTIMYLSVKSRSPEMATHIVNTIADLFVKLNLKMNRYKSDEVLNILENQLALAKAQLDSANQKLREFQEKYPWVVLANDTRGQITDITTMEEEKRNISIQIDDIQKILDRITTSQQITERISLTRELLTYLQNKGYPLASAFTDEFNTLTLERSSLLSAYAPTHSFVQDNERKIKTTINKIVRASNEYLSKLSSNLEQVDNNIRFERYKFQKLPSKAQELAELMRDQQLKSGLYSSILARYNEAKIERQVEVSDIFIVDYGTPPQRESLFEGLIKKALFGLIIALGMGIGFAILVDFFDKTAENVEELKEKFQIPVIGSIPIIKDTDETLEISEEMKGKPDPKLITFDYSPTIESESYRELRTKVLFMNQNKDLSSLLVTSLIPGEGKSLTAANLAITIAQQKIVTILIDGDLRRGVIHNVFANKKTPGLSDFLISNATVDMENLKRIIQPTLVPNLFLIPAGNQIPNPTEMLGSERLENVIKLLKSRYGMVLMDTAPLQATSDAAILARIFDGVLFIIKAKTTNISHLKQKILEYPTVYEKIIGVVLNMVKVDHKRKQYKYSYYNY
ncbi:MAG: polysaccharide biosynthesis tyrosine autokinase [Calditrichia bacterium]